MLRSLRLKNVGPAAEMVMDAVAPRYNLITGDNGLGKTFLLDCGWWALTRAWPGLPASPRNQEGAAIGYGIDTERGHAVKQDAPWYRKRQHWQRGGGRPQTASLVVFARVDGSFAAWDPERNYRQFATSGDRVSEEVPAFIFRPDDVESGLKDPDGLRTLCRGLIADVETWTLKRSPEFDLLSGLLASVGPGGERLELGELDYTLPGDARAFPTIKSASGESVSLLHLPAGLRRVFRLAYILAWLLSTHRRECERSGQAVCQELVVFFDEPEAHLHPRWQRTILPDLHAALTRWRGEVHTDVQLIAATHSPLVLASMEPIFDDHQDALWVLDRVDGVVKLERDVWMRRGDASRSLT